MSSKFADLTLYATGIGSVPFFDVDKTCEDILNFLPHIPFWPQLVNRSYVEDMNIQFTEGLSFITIDEEKRAPRILSTKDIEKKLAEFYEHFLADDFDYFSISESFAPGLYKLSHLVSHREPNQDPVYIKGQTVGPITLSAAVMGPDGKPVLHNPNLLEPLVNGLSIKAVWQALFLKKTQRDPIIFLDEPYLSGFGSAFSPIERDQVIEILANVISYIKEKGQALVGIHCCGNTDWAMLLETGPHIINFDASDYMEYFLLYKKPIINYLKNGGIIAWGIVPTASFEGDETVDLLFDKLKSGIDKLIGWGLDREMVLRQSFLTPACGLGTMEPANASKALELLAALSQKCRLEYRV